MEQLKKACTNWYKTVGVVTIVAALAVMTKLWLFYSYMGVSANFIPVWLITSFLTYLLFASFKNKWIPTVIYLVISLIMFSDVLYFSYFNRYLSVNMLGAAKFLGDISASIMAVLKPKFFLLLADCLVVFGAVGVLAAKKKVAPASDEAEETLSEAAETLGEGEDVLPEDEEVLPEEDATLPDPEGETKEEVPVAAAETVAASTAEELDDEAVAAIEMKEAEAETMEPATGETPAAELTAEMEAVAETTLTEAVVAEEEEEKESAAPVVVLAEAKRENKPTVSEEPAEAPGRTLADLVDLDVDEGELELSSSM